MFFEILVKTIVDAMPVLMTVLAFMFVGTLVYYVATHDGRPKPKVRPTMDMVNSTRFMSLE